MQGHAYASCWFLAVAGSAALACSRPEHRVPAARPPVVANASVPEDSAAVAGVLDRLFHYYDTQALDSLRLLFTDDFELIEGGHRLTAEQLVATIRALRVSHVTATFSYRRIVVVGDLAYQTFDVATSFLASGKPVTLKEQNTMVLRRGPTDWRVILWHSTPLA